MNDNNYNLSNKLLNAIKIIKELKEDLTQLEIHKLLYIEYCIYLKQYGKPLFNEEFEAWMYGPIIREIYYHQDKNHRYKTDYLNKYINKLKKEFIFKNEKNFLKTEISKIIKNEANVFEWIKWTYNDKCWNTKKLLQKIKKSEIKKHHIIENVELEWDKIIKYDK